MKKPTSRAGVGASSILLIIVVLCLTSFSILTLTSAQVDNRLTDRTIETVAAYYSADAAAQQRLSEIDAALLAGSDPTGWEDLTIDPSDPGRVQFAVDVGDGRSLAVTLTLRKGGDASPRYTIEAYRLVSTQSWGAEPAPDLLTISD